MSDDLLSKAADLQIVLKRCSKLLRSDSTKNGSSIGSSYKQRNKEILDLNNQISDLQRKVTSLKQYIKQLESEKDQLQKESNTQTNQQANTRIEEPSNTSAADTSSPEPFSGHYTVHDYEDLSLLLVFRYLSLAQLLAVQRVCKRWKRVSQDPLLWKQVVFIDAPLSQQMLCKIGEYCCRTTMIHLQGLIPSPALLDEDLQSYICRQKASLEPGLNSVLARCGSTITHLTISECSLLFTDRTLWIISKYCTNLSHLTYNSSEFPVSIESLWSLANSSTSLKELHLYPSSNKEINQRFNDHCLYVISNGFPLLTALTIGGSKITVTGIANLGSCLKHLNDVRIINGPSFSVASVENKITSDVFTGTESLCLVHTRISPQALVKLIETHPNLKNLEVTITFSDYFPSGNDNESQVENISKYKRIISNLQALAIHFRYRKIFNLTCN